MLSRRKGKILFLTLLAALFVSQGCGGRISSMPSMTLPVITETINPPATKTPSPKPTITDTATPDYVATQNFIETDSVNAVISTVEPVVLADYSSSDGKWQVEVIRYNCINYSYADYIGIIAYEQLKLINLSTGTEKIVDDQHQNCDGIGTYGFEGLYWSPSNRYYYYTDARDGSPGGCGNYVAFPIYRLDTVTWETIIVGGAHISPDKTKLALWQENEIVIWDLDKGEVGRVSPLKSNLYNGRIWWSLNSKSILYMQTKEQCAPNYGISYITNLDLTNFSQSLLTTFDSTGTEVPTTPVPSGVFALLFYPPLVMDYVPSIWNDDSLYAPRGFMINYLYAKDLTNCSIGVQGPTDFNGPHTSEAVRLGEINYTILSFPDSAPDYVSHAYLADPALATEAGLPVFWVGAKSDEWNECKKLAEDVLATLHSPVH